MEGSPLYHELAVGSVSHRGIIVPRAQVPDYIGAAQKNGQELYRSYYLYTEEILEHMKSANSVRNYKGSYHLPEIVFDIDKGVNTDETTLSAVRAFVEELEDEFVSQDDIRAFFSGRGYHIVTPDFFGFKPGPDLPQVVAATLKKWFPNTDAIFDGARIIRVAQTINRKSNLWKIPLTLDEVFSLEAPAILELAKQPRPGVKQSPRTDVTLHPNKIVLPPTVQSEKDGHFQGARPSLDDPNGIVTCMQKLYAEGTQVNRHNSIMRLTSAWRRAGIPREAILVLMRDRYPTLEAKEVDRVVNNHFDKGYQYSCQDAVMAANCDPRCKFFRKKNFAIALDDVKNIEKKFVEFVRSDWAKTSFDLGDIWPTEKPFRFYPGEYITVMGDTGLGKTAWVQNIIVALKSMKVLVFSLEVHDMLFFRRLVQIEYGMTKDEVFSHYMKQDNHLSERLGHITVTTTSPNIEAIKGIIAEVQPQIVVVDVIDGINVQYARSESEKLTTIATALKELAQQTNTIIFGVSHISKQAARNGQLDVHAAKGGSGIEQKSDKVIAIEGDREQQHRIVHSLKARDETPFRMPMMMDSSTFQYHKIDFNP